MGQEHALRQPAESGRDHRNLPVAQHIALGPAAALPEERQIIHAAHDEPVCAIKTTGAELMTEVVHVGNHRAQTQRVSAERFESRQRIAGGHLEAIREAAIQSKSTAL